MIYGTHLQTRRFKRNKKLINKKKAKINKYKMIYKKIMKYKKILISLITDKS